MSRSAYDLLNDSPDKLSSASLTPEGTLVRSSRFRIYLTLVTFNSMSAAKWGRTSLAGSGYNTVRGRLASISTRVEVYSFVQ